MGCCCCFSQQVLDKKQYLDESNQKKLHRIQPSYNLPNVQNSKLSQSQFLEKDGQKLKLLGNQSFKKKNYAMAIKYYQQAIETSKSDLSYYSNLALAFKANLQYKQSIGVIDQMIRNPKFKAEKNSALFAKGKLIKARSTMIIVKEYCLGGKFSQKNNHQHLLLINIAVDILQEMNSQPNVRIQNQQYLTTGLKLKHFLVSQIMPKSKNQNILHYLTKRFNSLSDQPFSKNDQQMAKYYRNRSEVVEQVTEMIESLKATALQEQKEYLMDPITYQYLSNGVIVPSGTTYNEQTLKQHFKNNGYNDPITHQIFQIGEKVIVRNNNLHNYATGQKKAVTKDDIQLLKY